MRQPIATQVGETPGRQEMTRPSAPIGRVWPVQRQYRRVPTRRHPIDGEDCEAGKTRIPEPWFESPNGEFAERGDPVAKLDPSHPIGSCRSSEEFVERPFDSVVWLG